MLPREYWGLDVEVRTLIFGSILEKNTQICQALFIYLLLRVPTGTEGPL